MQPGLKSEDSAGRTNALFLFGRDLRLDDHAGLAATARFGDIVAAIVLDPALLERFARQPRRAAYFCGAVSSLAASLAPRGVTLVCRRGALVPTVLRLAREADVATVGWSAAYDAQRLAQQRALQSALEESGLRVVVAHDAPAVHPEETAAARSSDGGRGYRAFAPYFAAWSAQARAPIGGTPRFAHEALRSDPLPEPREFGIAAASDAASETQARAAVAAYLAGPALQYSAARNVPADGPTSRLSSALAFGTVAARTVLADLDVRGRDPFLLAEERVALRAFVRALAQRDFFLQLAWFFEEPPDAPLQPRMRRFPFARTHPALAAWREGRTGFPLVDAGVRQLRATGWMHPRVRLVAASFLCFDLGVDWRVGRDAWEAELEEDDAALATGNWQWVAAVGADLAQFPRIYNPRKQLRAYDPRGLYVRTWIPELRHRPDVDLFEGPRHPPRRQLDLELFDGATYPKPVLDHESAARDFLRRYAAFTKNEA